MHLAPAVAAQSTGDSLPTPTPTLTPVSGPKVWVGRLVSNTLGVTEGQGSIFRVKVEGQAGARIELRSGNTLITGEAGSKPEYGPYTAEFAPVSQGVWTVRVPALGANVEVVADNYNLAVIEFVQIPVPEATQVVLPTPTSTPLGGQAWEGRLVSETWGIGAQFSRLIVQVVGRSNQPVRLSTATDIINTANTGQKPDELGPDVVEFTGLTPAKYVIEALGLNGRLEVELKPNTETRVEFRPQAPPPTATDTPLPPPATYTPAPPTATSIPTMTPTATDTPLPPASPTPTSTTTPLPSPTPLTRWLGLIEERSDREGGAELATLIIRVSEVEGLPVRLRALSDSVGSERRCLTGQGAAERDICVFEDLKPGQYLVAPEGLALSLPVMHFGGDRVVVVFDVEVLPSGITGWQGRLLKNSNGFRGTTKSEAVLTVRVAGRAGQVVALRSVRGTDQFCEVTFNPILGSPACEFGELGPGVYLVELLNTGAGLRLFVDGVGRAELEFSPSATQETSALAQSPPVVGQGAQPNRPPPTATLERPVAVVQPTPRPTATPFPTPTVTPTPTPAFAWQGRIVQTQNGVVGTIGVRAAGLKDHPVILRSGPWQSQPQLTGTKLELGEYATEFGGLSQGEYIVELVDLAELKVYMESGQFMLVEFRYDFVNPP